MKIALITGGSRGLGKSMALQLAANGTDVIVTYNTGKADAERVVAEIQALGRKGAALQLDVSKHATFAAFADTLKATLKSVWMQSSFDFLVNNAGVGVYAPIEKTTPEDFDAMVDIHLKGPFFLTQAVLPVMQDGGRIINVSSGLTRFTYPGYAAYAMMKGGVEVFTHYLAKELSARKIVVNTLAPGAIETDFGGGAVRDNKELNAMIAAQTPLGRVGLPDDIGGAIVAALSDGFGWVNGQRLEVSGGIHI
jgi:NAD(P)-dependent dehydrogenase (short-subunit alcohol dehydrogenase family)